MAESEPQFDPLTCVHAGDLREQGYEIPGDIPDCAWVHRASIRYEAEMPDRQMTDTEKRNRIFPPVTIKMIFDEPFRWININGTVEV